MSRLLDLGAPPIACFVVTDIETDGPTPGENSMRSFASAPACIRKAYPEDWFGGHRHTHKAIDDALGYASVLRHVLAYPVTQLPAGG